MSEFKMPSLGADMESAVLMEWKVKEGDPVTKGQVIAEVETSKGVIEIEVFETGVVEKILVEEETECAVGTPLALIVPEGESREESASETVPETEAVASEPEKAASPVEEEAAAPERTEVSSPTETPVEPTAPETEGRIKASPAARRKAWELGVDLAALSSESGAIQLGDVESAAKTPAKAPEADGMRQAIARAMSRSNAEIPHYYLSTPINMTPALSWLSARNAERDIKERILPAALLILGVLGSIFAGIATPTESAAAAQSHVAAATPAR